jgi:hypothetical protein
MSNKVSNVSVKLNEFTANGRLAELGLCGALPAPLSRGCFVRLKSPPFRHAPPRLRFAFGAAFALLSFVSTNAAAIENEWHVGGGVGLAQPTSGDAGYQTAPVLSLHAAYGLSDMFDVRVTLAGSMHAPDAPDLEKTTLALGTVGLAYKFDVIEWVPYFGVRAGYFHFGPAPAEPDASGGGAIGVMAGLDYSFSRSFAVGVELARDILLPEGGLTSGLLHAEYRLGY